jgi:hypothetical protein
MGPADYWGTQLWQASKSFHSLLATLSPSRFPGGDLVCAQDDMSQTN